MAEKRNILAVLAHCDDDVICGWPVLQDKSLNRSLLVVAMVGSGVAALRAVCRNEGINLIEHEGFLSRFSEEERTSDSVKVLVEETVEDISPDIIYTHNIFGEYGHSDHLFLNNFVVCRHADKIPVWISDIQYTSERWPHIVARLPPSQSIVKLDDDFWMRGKGEYEKAGCWTTNTYIDQERLRDVCLYEYRKSPGKRRTIVWLCDTNGWAFENQAREIAECSEDVNKLVMLKRDTEKNRCFYNSDDMAAINGADLVVAMTPACLTFVERRDGVVCRLSGVRST